MKKLVFVALCFLSLTAVAQQDKEVVIEKIDGQKPSKKQTQEIVIRSKGDKDKKITVEINGDKVTINGKPIAEFKDDDITINKKNIMIFDGKNRMDFAPDDDMEVFFNGPLTGSFSSGSSAFLGVNSMLMEDDNNDAKSTGAKITNVSKNSAAEKAGLKEGDIITKINNEKITSPSDLSKAINDKKPKDEVTVYYKRDGKESSTKATLGERKEDGVMSYSFSGPNGMTRSFTLPKTPKLPRMPKMPNQYFNSDGFERLNGLNDLENQFADIDRMFGRPKIGLKIQDVEEGSGVKVLDTDKDSPAEKAGLKKDDIITEINGKAVNNTDEARALLKPEENKNTYSVKAKRNGASMNFDIKIPKKLKTADL